MTLLETPHVITLPTNTHEADPMTWSLADAYAYAVEPKRQARILDISRYWRKGGTNWEKVKLNFDGVVICGAIGMREDVLLVEHVDRANEFDVPYNTFHIPDPLQNLNEQAQFYTELHGVKAARAWFDNECPFAASREMTMVEADEYMDALEYYHPMDAGEYSRWEIWKRQGVGRRLRTHKLWPAHYLYDLDRYRLALKPLTYLRYEPYFEQRAWTYPPGLPLEIEKNVVATQITQTGDARFYAANKYTEDPENRYGMTNADLNVSCIPHDEFMAWFWPQATPPDPVDPPTEPTGCWNAAVDAAIELLKGLRK